MKLIIGLGNPGQEYQNTRHNIGFQIVDMIADNLILKSLKPNKKFQAEICEGTFGNEKVILAKPQTFMNNSGLAVKKIKTFYKIKPPDIIIIHDDIDLPVGKIRISQSSSSGGHKGIDSIIKELKSKNFIRVRMGIANELREKIPAEKFVLQKFSSQDEKKLKNVFLAALNAVQMLIENEKLEKVQSKFN
ncbi:MAG: aminoacyl-tRNA hydrolase [Candidatus Buchananbacteria bacterium RBG_13_36_9]|uniref:Peptidyl-tRNA hydrolase n=1 Tax=Candidatus Buchananbacteria bacterium RBG_13_36_9 TaxID=1797530 RepID=A0A1G1XRN6_9BACT|nr:MAG: aminoacyl-tRNA hydrolase [Candidatus Buchananbacteria bacterium RBG_13_36_9]